VTGMTRPGRSGLELTGKEGVVSFLGTGGPESAFTLSSIPDVEGEDEADDSPRLKGEVANCGESKWVGSDPSRSEGEG
jgi:hypothetical protein